MSRRVVIADAGPLIALARADSLPLLRQLFRQVSMTTTVQREILPDGADFPDRQLWERTFAEGWIEVVDVPLDSWKALNPGVDAGEASAIQLALRWREDGAKVLLLMDDRAGRIEAEGCAIPLIGTAALIALAKVEGLIPAARPVLEHMARSGYYLGQALIDAVLADLGE